MHYNHKPVLLKEVIDYLEPKPNQNFVDCTAGYGGHLIPIMYLVKPYGKVLGIDLDPKAHEVLQKRIQDNGVALVRDNFRNIKDIVSKYSFHAISGVLIDLGFSSAQIEDPERGMAFESDTLDMRFGDTSVRAYDIINTWTKEDLINIFKQYGDERLAKPIAQKIIETREKEKISSARNLASLIAGVYRRFYARRSHRHPATKVFQALRMAVNDEIENLTKVLPDVFDILEVGGRLIVISFHSAEDRIVKHFFKQEDGKTLRRITKKPVVPTDEEIMRNPRSRSAKLRVAEKIG